MLNILFSADNAVAPSSATLQLQGSATVQFCTELRMALLDALNNTENLVVDVSQIIELDVSALQLLCAARRSAILRQKRLVLAEKVSGAFFSAVLDAGFNRTHTARCQLTADQACLWCDCTPARGEVTS